MLANIVLVAFERNVYTCIRNVYTCIYMYIHVYMQQFSTILDCKIILHVHMHTCIHAYIHTCIHNLFMKTVEAYMFKYDVYIYIYLHTHIHTCTHVHTCIHTGPIMVC